MKLQSLLIIKLIILLILILLFALLPVGGCALAGAAPQPSTQYTPVHAAGCSSGGDSHCKKNEHARGEGWCEYSWRLAECC